LNPAHWRYTGEELGIMSARPNAIVLAAFLVAVCSLALAEVGIPRGLFRAILERIRRLRLPATVPV